MTIINNVTSSGPFGKMRLGAALITVCLTSACSISSLIDVDNPSTILDTEAIQTRDGAIAVYNGAVTQFSAAYSLAVRANALMTDELTGQSNDAMISRNDFEGPGPVSASGSGALYTSLQVARVRSRQAMGFLKKYAPDEPKTRLANLYLIQGYISIFLGEIFCSGVALSEVIFEGDIEYGEQITTEQVFENARAMFDSAIFYAGDSTRFVQSAKIGRARALMNLNRYSDAVGDLKDIPTAFRHNMIYSSGAQVSMFYWQNMGTYETMGEEKGINGLNYITANDPRVIAENGGTMNTIISWQPKHLRQTGVINVAIGSGLQARLIEGEVMLKNNETSAWLTNLNRLRTDGTFTVTGSDTVWNAGTGGIAGLKPLQDPGTPLDRRMLHFREKAFWLFGLGQRQGDLRRLVRQYGMSSNEVYPTGIFKAATNTQVGVQYGPFVNLVPTTERANYKFNSCFDREA